MIFLNLTNSCPGGVAQLVGAPFPVHRTVTGSIPSQVTDPGFRFNAQLGRLWEAADACFSPALFPFLSLSNQYKLYLQVRVKKNFIFFINSLNLITLRDNYVLRIIHCLKIPPFPKKRDSWSGTENLHLYYNYSKGTGENEHYLRVCPSFPSNSSFSLKWFYNLKVRRLNSSLHINT